MNVVYNMDCLEAMRKMPDKFFDLAVVDPPYGSGFTENGGCGGWFEKYKTPSGNRGGGIDSGSGSTDTRIPRGGGTAKRTHYTFGIRKTSKNYENRRKMGAEIRKKITAWDIAPDREYFEELFRVSRNQIIWGGNYFDLPPTRCFIVFRKTNIPEKGFSMAPVEYAWTSFFRNAEIIEGCTLSKPSDVRFHPTQKPISLYAEIYSRFAKPGDKILDTHLGSGSSRIAAWEAGLDFVGYEIDKGYYDAQEKRFAEYTSQGHLFAQPEEEPTAEQGSIFDFLEWEKKER